MLRPAHTPAEQLDHAEAVMEQNAKLRMQIKNLEARVAGLEAHIETLEGWRKDDLDAATNHIEAIQGPQSGLREVYALAGEDPQLSKIINTTLERYPFP